MMIEEEKKVLVYENGVPIQNSASQVPMVVGLIQKVLGQLGSLASTDDILAILAFLATYLQYIVTMTPSMDEGSDKAVYPLQVLGTVMTNYKYGLFISS